MKVTAIALDVIEREIPAVQVNDGRGALGGTTRQGVLRVQTDAGIQGVTMVGQQGTNAEAIIGQIDGWLRPRVMGRDVHEREMLWQEIHKDLVHDQPRNVAWAHMDAALWDIAGKEAGVPVHQLLGTQRYEIPVYATYPPRQTTVEGYVDEALQLQGAGFPAYKVHPGAMKPSEAAKMAGMVRHAVGDDFTLMMDPNNGYSHRAALEVGRALDDNGYYWFEDPVTWNDYDAIGDLSRRLDTPLNMSDAAGFLLREAARSVRLGYPRLIRGTTRKLGITALKKLCGMLEAHGLNCEIGLAGNSGLNIANLHVMMSIPNCDYYEWWLPKEMHQWGVVQELELQPGGVLKAPEKPGLGIELDEGWITKHKVATL